MIVDKFTVDGKKAGQVELNDKIFGANINDELVYEFIRAANLNRRQGTHKTKERAEIRGGGIKPFRQKGTGRARQGTIRAPQFRGGGTVFGPRPRSYRIDLPKSLKTAAYKSIFSIKAKQGAIKVVTDFTIESGKTKEMNKVLTALGVEKGLLVDKDNVLNRRAIRNIETVKYNDVKTISGREIFYSRVVVFTEGALNAINEKYAKGE